MYMLLYDLLSDLIKIENVLLIVKNNGVVSEIRATDKIKQKDKWITIGENDDPAHMHINSELIKSARFIQEEKPERVSYSIHFYDDDKNRVVAAFFTKMYDDSKKLIQSRKYEYDALCDKYSSFVEFKKKPCLKTTRRKISFFRFFFLLLFFRL